MNANCELSTLRARFDGFDMSASLVSKVSVFGGSRL